MLEECRVLSLNYCYLEEDLDLNFGLEQLNRTMEAFNFHKLNPNNDFKFK